MGNSCNINRIIQFQQALTYCTIVIYDTINNKITDITNSCQFSWSTDGVCWTNWTNLQTYNNICKNIESDYFLRVLIHQGLHSVKLNGEIVKCYNVSLDNSNVFLKDFCSSENLFQPYNNLDCAMQLQQQLSDSIVCMFGIPIYYLRVSPKFETRDYTFKEYVLHNVDSIKQIKLMIPDGTMPSSKPTFSDFDFDWESDWEVELGKTQFANAFGDESFPKQRDLIYIPMMKRMWEVNSAYDEKNEGLMWRSTTWKLALVKYNEKTNIEQAEFEQLIDNWVINTYEEVFGKKEENEQERDSGIVQIQSPRFAATNLSNIFLQDAMRKQITKQDIIIQEKQLNHGSIVTAKGIYKFRNENGCIVYQQPYCGDCGSISLIIETPGKTDEKEYSLFDAGNIELRMKYENNRFNIIFNELSYELEGFKTYMIHLNWNRSTMTTEMRVYEYIHPNDMPIYKLRPEMYSFNFEKPLYEKVGMYNQDFNQEKTDIQLHTYPLISTNFKVYNQTLTKEQHIKESIKYTTSHEACIVNDLARLVEDEYGYAVK